MIKLVSLPTIIDVLLAGRADNWYIIACGEAIIGTSYDNWFRVKYLRSCLLHHRLVLRELYVTALFCMLYLLYRDHCVF